MAGTTTTNLSVHPPVAPVEAASPTAEPMASPQARPKHRGPPLNQIYALPAPIRTFPLPSFYPNNPLSLFHLVYSWVKQVISPPPSEPYTIYSGTWDPATRSVHINDPIAARALWEQGFYGKGSLSRSEPNWLKREQIRRGIVEGDVSEERTATRREERRQVKWERARTEQEALERTRREEAQLNAGRDAASVASPADTAALGPQAEPVSSDTPYLKRQITSDESILLQPSAKKAKILVEPVSTKTNGDTASAEAMRADSQRLTTSRKGDTKVLLTSPRLSSIPMGPVARLATPTFSFALRDSIVSEAPVDPSRLLALPNSLAELQVRSAPPSPRQILVFGEDIPSADNAKASLPNSSAPVQSPIADQDQVSQSKAPVGPLELLAVPNSLAQLHAQSANPCSLHGVTIVNINSVAALTVPNGVLQELPMSKAPVGPLELLALPNSLSDIPPGREPALPIQTNGTMGVDPGSLPNSHSCHDGDVESSRGGAASEQKVHDVTSPVNGTAQLNRHANGSATGPGASELTTSKLPTSQDADTGSSDTERQTIKRRKSVRFSTPVESTTFLRYESPSPGRITPVAKCNGAPAVAETEAPSRDALQLPIEVSALEESLKAPTAGTSKSGSESSSEQDVLEDIQNKEHLQLSPEEAFFLAYGIGALSVLDPVTRTPIPRQEVLALFRSHSYFPPVTDLQPNDPFLIHYVVYHHFRSLGWVPRHGIKFGVDWMLYTRGPVFDHAEFGLIVVPAYSHPWWKENGQESPRKSWHWLHGVNRVLSHVLKSLVMVYVDVPPPHVFDSAMAAGGISAALTGYKVREFMVRRWSSNRNR